MSGKEREDLHWGFLIRLRDNGNLDLSLSFCWRLRQRRERKRSKINEQKRNENGQVKRNFVDSNMNSPFLPLLDRQFRRLPAHTHTHSLSHTQTREPFPYYKLQVLPTKKYMTMMMMMSMTTIRSTLMMVVVVTILVVATTAVHAAASGASVFQDGDTCGVTSSDFLTYSYRSEYLVAGQTGCTLGGDGSEGCFCAPDLSDGESLSEWKWQCNNSVAFGPTTDQKTCPESVPVPKEFGELDVVLNRRRGLQQQPQQRVSCDTNIHPTGRPGDEVCPYSDCDDGGDHSAICACIDMEQYGMGEGTEWICMHATCSCGDDDDDQPTTGKVVYTDSASVKTAPSAILLTLMSIFFFLAL